MSYLDVDLWNCLSRPLKVENDFFFQNEAFSSLLNFHWCIFTKFIFLDDFSPNIIEFVSGNLFEKTNIDA